jgi:hypothetical protein
MSASPIKIASVFANRLNTFSSMYGTPCFRQIACNRGFACRYLSKGKSGQTWCVNETA